MSEIQLELLESEPTEAYYIGHTYYYLPGGPSILNKDVHISLILLPLLILLRCVLSTYYHDTLTLIGSFLFGSIIGVRKSRVRSRLVLPAVLVRITESGPGYIRLERWCRD